jgi:hypothetical protein
VLFCKTQIGRFLCRDLVSLKITYSCVSLSRFFSIDFKFLPLSTCKFVFPQISIKFLINYTREFFRLKVYFKLTVSNFPIAIRMFQTYKFASKMRLRGALFARHLNRHIPRVPVRSAEPVQVEVKDETIQLLEKLSLVCISLIDHLRDLHLNIQMF